MLVFRGTMTQLRVILANYSQMVAGNASTDQHGIGASFRTVVGYTMMADIFMAFITKSRGGMDEMGIKWPELSPATIAARRIGKGDLKDMAIYMRKKVFDREYKRLKKRFMLNLPEHEAEAKARRSANLFATQRTGRTKIATLGFRNVEILRDEGVLAGSLTPGTIIGDGVGSHYSPSGLDGSDDQIFDFEEGDIVIGTAVEYAGFHDRGTKRIPRRQIYPDEQTGIPEEWQKNIEQVAVEFSYDAIQFLLNKQL